MTRDDVSRAFDRVLYAGMAASVIAAPLVSEHTVASGPVLCPFRRLTGVPCPGCGMTRSFVALAHGDLSASLHFHPLGPVLMSAFVVLLAWKAASLLTGAPAPRLSPGQRRSPYPSRPYRYRIAAARPNSDAQPSSHVRMRRPIAANDWS